MAEITQQTALVIEVQNITDFTEEESIKIRRAVARGNGLNIVFKDDNARYTKVLSMKAIDGIVEGSECRVSYIVADTTLETSVGKFTAEDLKDEIFNEE